MTVAYVGIGSNLEDPAPRVRQSFEALAALPHTRLVKKSSLYRSAPLGFAAQPDFVNAVAEIETGLAAGQLLAELQEIERRHGRSRSFPDAPRTLDLDLLLYGCAELRMASLTVPHPRMHERAFVLQPLVEIAPEVAIPGRGPARHLLDSVKEQRIERLRG